MKAAPGNAVQLTRQIRAKPERVFRAFTDAKDLKHWFAPQGFSVPVAEVDLRVGGSYRISMRAPDGKVHTAIGEYREITPPRRLVYTWRWEGGMEGDDSETLVTVEFRERGGTTEVVFTHEGFLEKVSRDKHNEGWTSILERLAEFLPSEGDHQ